MSRVEQFISTGSPKQFLLGIFLSTLLCGCAGRHPVVDRRQPLDESGNPSLKNRGVAGSATSIRSKPGHARSSALAARSASASPRINSQAYDAQGYVEEGHASWYGAPFHGRRAANGEVYDMNQLTAAHRTLPFDTVVRVTNLINGLSADVRITDRGPFVENRLIDLSHAAADAIGMLRAGVERVRLEVISGANPNAGYFTVQVGAFRDRDKAARLRDRLLRIYSPVFIETNSTPLGIFHCVHVGKILGEDAAVQFAEALQRTEKGITPFVVRLDENLAEEKLNER